MKKTVMKKWVKALRSGKFKQGFGLLKYQDGKGIRHCCLGVLCELYNQDMKKKKKKTIKVIKREQYDAYKFSNKYDVPPKTVLNWAGMKSATGKLQMKDKETKINLVDLNDTGSTFKNIANIIENNYENL